MTGAAGGIGKALCLELEKRGYFVLGTDKSGSATAARYFFQTDLQKVCSDSECRDEFRQEVLKRLDGRPLKGLINNAAVQRLASLAEFEENAVRESLEVNVLAPMLLSQLFLAELQNSRGSIINIGSIHSRLTKPGFICYATTKSALEGLTRSMAVELGAQQIRVNLIQPGAVETTMLRASFAGDPEGFGRLKICQPVQRLADPAEIARVAAFLLSNEAVFMTGATVAVDGGIGARLHDPQ